MTLSMSLKKIRGIKVIDPIPFGNHIVNPHECSTWIYGLMRVADYTNSKVLCCVLLKDLIPKVFDRKTVRAQSQFLSF